MVTVEAQLSRLEKTLEGLNEIDGVLAIYTTYCTIEDEESDASY